MFNSFSDNSTNSFINAKKPISFWIVKQLQKPKQFIIWFVERVCICDSTILMKYENSIQFQIIIWFYSFILLLLKIYDYLPWPRMFRVRNCHSNSRNWNIWCLDLVGTIEDKCRLWHMWYSLLSCPVCTDPWATVNLSGRSLLTDYAWCPDVGFVDFRIEVFNRFRALS